MINFDELDPTLAFEIGELEEAAKQAEQERIIKLLEADMEHAFGDNGKCLYTIHLRQVCNCDIIALIKGENKEYPLPLPPKTANNTETAPLSRPMKLKGENK